jgi:hypothetical protein
MGGRGERGQASAEYLGMVVVVAALIAAIALSPIGEAIGAGLKAAVCRMLGGSCPTEAASDWAPTNCITGSSSGSLGFDASIGPINFGQHGSYLTERRSDGKYLVTYSDSKTVGVGVTPAAYGSIEWGDTSYGGGVYATANANLVFTGGQVWQFDDEDDAKKWISWHRTSEALPNALPVGGSIVKEPVHIGQEILSHTPFGQKHPKAETVARFEEGGVDFNASAAGLARGPEGVSAYAEAVLQESLGTRTDEVTGAVTYYLPVKALVDAGISDSETGSLALQAGASAVYAVTYDQDMKPQTLAITTYRYDEPGGDLSGNLDARSGNGDGVYFQAGGPDAEPPSLYQSDAVLDLTDPVNRRLWNDVLGGGRGSAIDPVGNIGSLADSIRALQDRVYDTGQVSVVEYDADAQRYGATILGSVAGGTGGLDKSSTSLRNAWYFDRDKGTYVPWTECTDAP